MSIDVNIGSQSINMANGNFASLWSMLDLPVESEGSVLAGDLTARIMLTQAMGVQGRPQVREGNWVNCGMDEDYISHRFQSMLDALAMVNWDEEVVWY